MKLKRMWPAISIWVLFVIFDVIMVASSGFFSGLFPSDKALPYTAALTVLGVAVMGVLMFFLGKISDNIEVVSISKTLFSRIIYVLMLITILLGGIVYRYDALARSTMAPGGKLSLYENAMVGAASIGADQDLLSIMYSGLLNLVLIFTGNRMIFALLFQIALFVIFALCAALVSRLLLGKTASIVTALYLAFMPVFSEDFMKPRITTDGLFYVLFGLELLIVAIYLKADSLGVYRSKAYALWCILVGAAVGFMTYVDAGTAIVVLPFLLAGFFILDNKLSGEIFRFIFILVGALTTFFGMILQEGGTVHFNDVLFNWSHYFFKNINTFNTFWTYTNYKIEYLVTFIVMTGVAVGFWRNRRFEQITPWLLSTMIIFFATPFFGATRTNSEFMLTVFFAFVLGAVASLLTMESNDNAEAVAEEEEEEKEAAPVNSPYPDHLVVKPENGKYDPRWMNNDSHNDYDPLEPVIKTDNKAVEPEGGYLDDEDDQIEDNNSHEVAGNDIGDAIAEADNSETSEIGAVNALDENSKDDHDHSSKADIAEKLADDNDSDNLAPAFEIEEASQPQNVVDEKEIHSANDAFEGYAPRFVPEGMVLPVGAEDEMDIAESQMKMPEFTGTIGLNRAKHKEVASEEISIKEDAASEEISIKKDATEEEPSLKESVAEEKMPFIDAITAGADPKIREAARAKAEEVLDKEAQENKLEPIKPATSLEPSAPSKPEKKYKYEFDLELKPGDDFDI